MKNESVWKNLAWKQNKNKMANLNIITKLIEFTKLIFY